MRPYEPASHLDDIGTRVVLEHVPQCDVPKVHRPDSSGSLRGATKEGRGPPKAGRQWAAAFFPRYYRGFVGFRLLVRLRRNNALAYFKDTTLGASPGSPGKPARRDP